MDSDQRHQIGFSNQDRASNSFKLIFRMNIHHCLDHPVSTNNLATLFEMNERTVPCNLRQGLQEPEPLVRHNALDAQSEAALVGASGRWGQ
jgi:hypothetical protein